MINWLVSLRQTNDSPANKHEGSRALCSRFLLSNTFATTFNVYIYLHAHFSVAELF